MVLCFRKLNNIKDWLNTVGLIADRESSNQDQNISYQHLVHRMLGYMALKPVNNKSNISMKKANQKAIEIHKKLVGKANRENHEKLVGTPNAVDAENPTSVVDQENIISIFLSQAQMGILHSKRPYVILTGDYGTGKTFLLKVIIQHLNIIIIIN